jgi:hypothetical protein
MLLLWLRCPSATDFVSVRECLRAGSGLGREYVDGRVDFLFCA